MSKTSCLIIFLTIVNAVLTWMNLKMLRPRKPLVSEWVDERTMNLWNGSCSVTRQFHVSGLSRYAAFHPEDFAQIPREGDCHPEFFTMAVDTEPTVTFNRKGTKATVTATYLSINGSNSQEPSPSLGDTG